MQTGRLEMERNTAGSEPGLYFDFAVDWCGWENLCTLAEPGLGDPEDQSLCDSVQESSFYFPVASIQGGLKF